MFVNILKSKIHLATVTDGNVDYEGSLTIDIALMEKVGMLPYERILIGNMKNGNRFETYAIPGPRGKRDICLNGACAHLGKKGDRLTIMSFASVDPKRAKSFKPKKLNLDRQNRPTRIG
ncbi:MAG: aspartate 1-decarboxylase [Verrucomicrobiae bacterium]|nr:aspartate 1-decarboxylase [Verrucomicrobiae bacterium]